MPNGDPQALFAVQFLWFLIAWTVVATIVIEPRIRSLDTSSRLTIWTAPQFFRVLGVGLLVPNLAPELPASFAIPAAIGDSITAVLALAAVVALHRGSARARMLAWLCHIVGVLDLLIALPHAARIGAATYLQGQWYVPALIIPLMIVSHVMSMRTLMQHDAASGNETPR